MNAINKVIDKLNIGMFPAVILFLSFVLHMTLIFSEEDFHKPMEQIYLAIFKNENNMRLIAIFATHLFVISFSAFIFLMSAPTKIELGLRVDLQSTYVNNDYLRSLLSFSLFAIAIKYFTAVIAWYCLNKGFWSALFWGYSNWHIWIIFMVGLSSVIVLFINKKSD